jgi:hypothetical protein
MSIGIIGERKCDEIDSGLSYSPSLEAAVNLILGDPAFVGDSAMPSFKFLSVLLAAEPPSSSETKFILLLMENRLSEAKALLQEWRAPLSSRSPLL